jgi:hypothetical protein
MYQFYKLVILLFIAAPVFILSGCKEKEPSPREYSRVTTQEVTDINTTGATFHGEVFYYAPAGVEDHGFVWSTSIPTLTSSNKKSLGPKTGKGSFFATIQTGLKAGVNYYVRAYVLTKNYTVYGKEVTFISKGGLAPKIVKFEPTSARIGDTITVYGENFSADAYDNTLTFGKAKAYILKISENSLTAIVPDNLTTILSKLQLTYVGQSVTSADEFTLKAPIITSFSPTSGITGTRVTIRGKGFSGFPELNTVKFGNLVANVEIATNTQLYATVPPELAEGSVPISVTVAGQTTTTSNLFKNTVPLIAGFSPASATFGDIITITGDNFGTSLSDTKVSFDYKPAKVLSVTATQIRVEVPPSLSSNASTLTVEIKNQKKISTSQFTLLAPIITSFTPTKSEMGAIITITGKNFQPNKAEYGDYNSSANVTIGQQNAIVTSASTTELKVVIPTGLSTVASPVAVSVNNQSTTSSTYFELLNPVISSVSTNTPQVGQSIIIKGLHFSPYAYDNKVFFGSIQVTADVSSSTSLTVTVPDYLPSGKYKIAESVADQLFTYDKEFVAP